MPEVPLLKLENIGKEYFGNSVLADVSFALNRGEILGLVGENGAGKSTLMNILFGMPVIASTGGYEGTIFLDGLPVRFSSPFDALGAGIGMVHQEFSLIPGFSAAENILLNREELNRSPLEYVFSSRLDTLNRPAIRHRAERAVRTLGIDIGVDTVVSEMPVGYKQFIEIAREIDRSHTRLLVLDEPTAVLTETEARILMDALKKLAEGGISIIFISHRLHEVRSLCDRIVVLRDGRVIRETPAHSASIRDIAAWMVGRQVEDSRPPRKGKISGEIALSVKNLWVDMPGETVRDVTFDVRKGEIFGIGGLAGQGKLGIPNGIMGLFPSGGEVSLFGRTVELNQPRKALDSRMAFVSEDRRGVGLLLGERIDWNITFTAMQVQNRFLKGIPGLGKLVCLRDDGAISEETEKYIKALEIRCTGPGQRAVELSGGNQQKVCLARAFAMRPDLLLICEPTRGIDVGAKELVLNTLRRYNEEYGTTILITSSELEELRSVCDRVAIVGEGKIAGVLPAVSPAEQFGLLMMGDMEEDSERREAMEAMENA
ncbi:MAG: sugar ABC transporter ATP-binding protein [Synergistaceae bacterium]|nr:sugar ABC transporter ATP-binding protein [Synergistaceae bacterium]